MTLQIIHDIAKEKITGKRQIQIHFVRIINKITIRKNNNDKKTCIKDKIDDTNELFLRGQPIKKPTVIPKKFSGIPHMGDYMNKIQ